MRRVRELDALRGLAALAIVIYHFWSQVLPFGWAAVDLFFALSGFLITGIILRYFEAPGFLTTFYLRRGLRIWPIYYLSILALLAGAPWLPRPVDPAGLPYVLTYTQYLPRYWGGADVDFTWYLRHTWTLAIEEQFYLVWPLLLMAVGRRRLPFVALGVLAGSVAARAYGFSWWILIGRSDGFALGALLAWGLADHERILRVVRPLRCAFGSVALATLGYLIFDFQRDGLPNHGEPRRPASTVLVINLFCAAILGLVAIHAGRPALRCLRGPILGYLGKISYGLYLYHMIIIRIKMDYVSQHQLGKDFIRDFLVFVGSFVAAILSWHLIEQPILAWKDRWDYGRDRAAVPPGTKLHPAHEAPTTEPGTGLHGDHAVIRAEAEAARS